MEISWWNKDPEAGKYQVCATVHGGNIAWHRKQGHHTSWLTHVPSEADWDRFLVEAESRVPRRLISPKQFEAIRQLRPS